MPYLLLVEDEPELREEMAEEISEEGYELKVAESGRNALEILVDYTPDIILSDISMPEMDGYALLDNVRNSLPHLTETPFIFLSAFNTKEDIIKGKKLGVDDYLVKPVDFDILFATLEARLAQVNRMVEKKEQQFVKLYKTLTTELSPVEQNQPGSSAEGNDEGICSQQKLQGSCLHYEELLFTYDRYNTNKEKSLNDYIVSFLKSIFQDTTTEIDDAIPGRVMLYNQDSSLGLEEIDRENLTLNIQQKVFDSELGLTLSENFSKLLVAQDLRIRDLPFDIALSETEEASDVSKAQFIQNKFLANYVDKLSLKKYFSTIVEEGQLSLTKFVSCNDKVKKINFFNYDKLSDIRLQSSYAFCDTSIRKLLEFQRDMSFLDLLSKVISDFEIDSSIAIDVHYDTLAKPEKIPQYRKKYEAVLQKTKCKLFLCVRGFPKNIDMAKCANVISSVSLKKAGWIAYFNPWVDGGLDTRRLKVPYIAWSLPDIYGADLTQEHYEKLKSAYKLCGGAFLLRDVPKNLEISEIQSLGFSGLSYNQ